MKTTHIFFGWVFIINVMIVSTYADTLCVDASASPGGDGQTWQTAYRFFQDALVQAQNGDSIWVAQGIYRPDTSSTNPNGTLLLTDSFVLKQGVHWYGGFVGYEDPDTFNLDDRDVQDHPTILTGDLLGNDDPNTMGAEMLTDPTRTDNSYKVISGVGITDARIDGFVITAGHGQGTGDQNRASGLDNGNNSNPIVENCYFYRNTGVYGGAVFNYRSTCPMKNVRFKQNASGYQGGAIMNGTSLTTMTLTNCQFIENFSSNSGGAVYNKNTGLLQFENCIFTKNAAGLYGNGQGGAIYNINASQIAADQCTFYGNIAKTDGGAIYNNAAVVLQNSILWDNEDNGGTDETAQVHNDAGSVDINYCCMMGWTGTLGGSGNFDADPLFVNPEENNFCLKSQAGHWNFHSRGWNVDSATSPCIDAGNPDEPIGFEIQPNGAVRNLGAYGTTQKASRSAFTHTCDLPKVADINGDCLIDMTDLAFLAQNWIR